MTPYGGYEVSGLVFAARTLFGFTLGALLGLTIRRTLTAMAATGIAWTAVIWASMTYLRPSIRHPITTVGRQAKGPIPGSGGLPFNANVVSHWFQNSAGRHVSYYQVINQAITANGGNSPTPDQFTAWMTRHGYSQWVSYLPNTWFWHFQTIEAAGYTIVAVALAIITVLAVRRRVL